MAAAPAAVPVRNFRRFMCCSRGTIVLDLSRRRGRRDYDPPCVELQTAPRLSRWLDESRRDLQYAARSLRKSPAFAATAVATLALAIGASTVMFSVLNGVVLRRLPYASPEQLVMLWTEDPT